MSQHDVLKYLEKNNNATYKELSESLGVGISSITKNVNNLEKQELVYKTYIYSMDKNIPTTKIIVNLK